MLLAPIALLLSLLAIPIILMYVLKLRRQEQLISSTYLWNQILEDVQANAPWQRLRFNILLLLQLLALAALVLALARPAYSRSHVIAGDLVVILDQSYGMQAQDVSPSRFAVAQARARALAGELGSGSVMSVIGMGAQPRLLVADSADQGTLDRAIGRLQPGVAQPNFLAALSLAASLARSGQSIRVEVLTSRDSGISSLPLPVSFPVDIVRIGGRLRDLGITGFGASQRGSSVEAVARVSNFGADTARSDLDLLGDGRLLDVRPLSVFPHRVQNLFWTDLPLGVQRFEVRLSRHDDVAGDKVAWAAIPGQISRRVLLVSNGDYFLEAALVDDPSLSVTAVPPAAFRPGMERSYDLAIFDGCLPPALPSASSLLVAPPAGQLGPLRFGANALGGSVVTAPGTASPLLAYVDLSDVHVAQTRSASLPAWLQPAALSNGHTVLAAGEQNGTRLALVSFSLEHSDWPLRISFPIVLENVLHYLAPGLTLGANDITAGQAVKLFPPPATRRLVVTRPDGASEQLAPPFPPFTDTSRPGLYGVEAVTAGGTTQRAAFAANFFPARPAPAAGPAVLHLGKTTAGKTLTASVPVVVIPAFVLLALIFLGTEWWIAFRGMRLL